tara:strand:- start:23975 stop:24364 length:390 start_codon:yes stop_codon:yes gene_type:complete
MGVITIIVSEENTDLNVTGKIGTGIPVNTSCSMTVLFGAKSATGAWVEFDYDDSQSVISITRNDAVPFVNGIQMGIESIDWTVTISNYVSANAIQNTILGQVTCTMKDVEGGTQIDQKSVSRYHTGISC